MTQWAATAFCWILLALLIATGYALWAVIVATGAVGLVLAIVIAGGVAGHIRRLRHGRDIDQAIALVSDLPGPPHPQASGVTSDEDTGVSDEAFTRALHALLDKEAGQ